MVQLQLEFSYKLFNYLNSNYDELMMIGNDWQWLMMVLILIVTDCDDSIISISIQFFNHESLNHDQFKELLLFWNNFMMQWNDDSDSEVIQ